MDIYDDLEDETIVPAKDRIKTLVAKAALGNQIVKEFYSNGSAINLIFDKARTEAEIGLTVLSDSNLNTEEGLAQARTAQAHVHRYRDLIRWMDEAINEADQSDDLIAANTAQE